MTAVDDRLPVAPPLQAADDGPPRELLASWPARVLAVVLDNALIAAVTFLVLPVHPVTPMTLPGLPPTAPGDGLVQNPALQGDRLWWVAALVAVMMLGQAYLGTTPGKLVLGIAVVRRDDARPAGLLLTAVRAAVHVVDGLLLMIGFLRPLWHPLNATFADSAARTVVLRTAAPLPFRARRGAPPTAPPWQRGERPRWRHVAWWTTAVLSGPALVLAYGPTAISGGVTAVEHCDAAGAPYDADSFVLVGARVERPPAQDGTIRRLGVERAYVDDLRTDVRVGWDWAGTLPEQPVELRLAFTSADRTVTRTVEATLDDVGVLRTRAESVSSFGPGTIEGDQLVVPHGVVEYLGAGWTWTASARSASGDLLGQCSGPSPAPAR